MKSKLTYPLSDSETQSIDELLQDVLSRLDAAGRYDVSAHVDLALHQFRGTRGVLQVPSTDTLA